MSEDTKKKDNRPDDRKTRNKRGNECAGEDDEEQEKQRIRVGGTETAARGRVPTVGRPCTPRVVAVGVDAFVSGRSCPCRQPGMGGR